MQELDIEGYTALARTLNGELKDEITHVQSSHIHNWCARDSIPSKYRDPLSSVLKCNPEWLYSGSLEYVNIISREDLEAGQISIPIYKSRGEKGESITVQNPVDSLVISAKLFLNMTGLQSSDMFRLIMCQRDSMEPTINNGDLVLFDLSSNERVDGVKLVEHSGLTEVKRIMYVGHQVHLLSDNARYPAKTLNINEVATWDVLYVFGGKRV